jgi:hypothetical protein
MAKKQAVNGERGRWSAKAKREAVLRLLRGKAIDALSREVKVTAIISLGRSSARLGWKDLGKASSKPAMW